MGDDLLVWFELFSGIVVYRPAPTGGHVADGWLNWSDIENRIAAQKLLVEGMPYDPTNSEQREKMLQALVNYAGTFVTCKLLERRRQAFPPSLDYRLTPFGNRVGNWGYGTRRQLRKRALFFVLALVGRTHKLRKIITVGAVGWGILNAVRFYATAASWAESLPFAAWSAVALTVVLFLWLAIKSKLEGSG